MLSLTNQAEPARVEIRTAITEAERSGDPYAIACAYRSLMAQLPMPERLAYVERGLDVLGDDGDGTELRCIMMYNQPVWLESLGRFEEYDRLLPRAPAFGERAGTPRAGIVVAAAGHCHLRGEWDEALVHLEGVDLDFRSRVGNACLDGFRAVILLHLGRAEEAAAYVERIEQVIPQLGFEMRRSYLHEALALAAERAGDTEGAIVRLRTILDDRSGPGRQDRVDETVYLTRPALAAGDPALAREAARVADEESASEQGAGGLAAIAARNCHA